MPTHTAKKRAANLRKRKEAAKAVKPRKRKVRK